MKIRSFGKIRSGHGKTSTSRPAISRRSLETLLLSRELQIIRNQQRHPQGFGTRPVFSPPQNSFTCRMRDTSRFVPESRLPSTTELGVAGVPTIGYLGTLFPWREFRACPGRLGLYPQRNEVKAFLWHGCAASESAKTIAALSQIASF